MKSLKIDDKIHSTLKRLKREKRKKDLNDVIAMLLNYEQILEQKINVEVKPQTEVDETFKCVNRIFHKDIYYCVTKPPKMIKLETLDICKVCKAREYGFKDNTKIKKEVKEAQDYAWVKNPKRNVEGMVFCENDGLWVFLSKCQKCLRFECEHHPLKKKERELYGNL